MKKKTFPILFIDLCAALLFALGASCIVFPLLGHSVPLLHRLVILLCLACFFALSGIRFWVPEAVLLLLALLLGIACYYQKIPFPEGWTFSGFLSWIARKMPVGSIYDTVWVHYAIYTFLLSGLLLLYDLLIRRLFSFWILAAGSLALLVFQIFFWKEPTIVPFVLQGMGLIICLPRLSVLKENRFHAQKTALIFSLFIMALTWLIGPKAGASWTSRGIQHLSHDVEDILRNHFGTVPELPVTSMRSMGWMPQKDRLGGDIELSDDEELISIKTDRPFLLRSEVLDTYTGQSWTDSGKQGTFRLDSLFWKKQQKQAYNLDLPDPKVQKTTAWKLVTFETEATLRNHFTTRSVFLPYHPDNITLQNKEDLYFNRQGETIYSSPYAHYYVADFTARPWNIYHSGYDRALLELEKFAALFASGKEDPLLKQNLQLPETLPDSVRELAEMLCADADTPLEKVLALKIYLSQNCSYTLTPGPSDPEVDFVASFLDKREGYCVYYATALTVLARAVNVPARYVTGYWMLPDSASAYYTVTAATAHAWTEIYLAGLGWVPVDCLGTSIFDTLIHKEEEQIEEKDEPIPDLPEEEEIIEEEILTEPEPEITRRSVSPLRLILILAAAALLGYGLYKLGSRWYPVHYSEHYIQKHHPDTADASEYLATDLHRQLRLLSQNRDPGEPITAFYIRCAAFLEDPSESPAFILADRFPQMAAVLNRLRFGGLSPSEEEVGEFIELHTYLEERVRATYGSFGYFLHRFLLHSH